MSNKIINRVANSKLVTINLEDYYPEGKRLLFDLKDWLHEGLVLREKEFRNQILAHDWSQYKNTYVALMCSTDAIIPGWAYTLLSLQLEPFAKKIMIGDLELLETSIFQDIINTLDVLEFKDQSLIIKGCTNKPIPQNAYIMLATKLKPVAKSIMYGGLFFGAALQKQVVSA